MLSVEIPSLRRYLPYPLPSKHPKHLEPQPALQTNYATAASVAPEPDSIMRAQTCLKLFPRV